MVIPYILLIVVLAVADQLIKFWVRANIPLYGSVSFIPQVMDLTYVQNTGMAFSLLEDYTWALTILSGVVTVVLTVLMVKRFRSQPLGAIPLSLVIAGAIGNFIDRAVFGFVTDMFRPLFVEFAVFNLADVCVVIGGIVFCIYFVFCGEKNNEPGEDEAEHDEKVCDTTEACDKKEPDEKEREL